MFSQQSKPRQRSLVSSRRSSFRPRVESLEDRLAPATHTWTGTTSDQWSVATNWTGGAPAVGETDVVLIFNGISNTTNTNDIAGLKVKTIQFNNNASNPNYVILGQAISLFGSIEVTNTTSTNVLLFDIKLSGNVAVSSVAAATTLIFGGVGVGVLSGTGGMIKSGPGTVELAGNLANTYTGTTRVNGGMLDLQKAAAALAIVGPLVIGDGIFAGVVEDVVRLDGQSNQIADTAKITVNGGGLLNLNGNNETIGPLTLAGGGVGSGAGTLTLAGNVTAKPSGDESTITGLLNLGSATRTFSVSTGANMTIPANIASAGVALNKTGAGVLKLSGANTGLLGAVNVAGGTLIADSGTALGATSAGTTVKKGATLRQEDSTIAGEPLTLSGRGVAGRGALQYAPAGPPSSGSWSGNITLLKTTGEPNVVIYSENGTYTLSGVLSGSAGLTKIGATDLVLSGSSANTYAGTTRVNEGALGLNKSSGVAAIPAGLIIGDDSGTDSVVLNASEQIASTAIVEVNLSGTLNLNNQAETVGGLIADGGNVSIGTGFFLLGGNVTVPRSSNIVAAVGGFLGLGAIRTINVAKNKALTVNAAIIDGTGTGGITKSGSGELVLQSGANSYTGVTTIAAGILSISHNDSLGGLGAAARTEVQAGATLQLNGGLTSVTESLTLFGGSRLLSLGSSNNLDGPITLTALPGKPRAIMQTESTLDLLGVISGTGGFTKTGSGILGLGGSSGNTYTGATHHLGGQLQLSKSSGNAISGDLIAGDGLGSDVVTWFGSNIDQIANTSDVLVKSTGRLNLNTQSDTIDALTVQDGGVVTNGTLTVV